MIPDFSDVLTTIEQYRYSIIVGIALLYFAPLLFPVGWEMASATWRYASAVMFFLSAGMILSRDLWPKVKQLFGIGVNKRQVSLKILKACKKEGGEPPFEPSRFTRAASFTDRRGLAQRLQPSPT